MDFDATARWRLLSGRMDWDRDAAGQVYEWIHDSYSQYFRAYHNLDHLAECFGHFDRIRRHLARPDMVDYALWMHDLVCVPGSICNEALSAMAAEQWADRLGAPEGFGRTAGNYILLTGHGLTAGERGGIPPDAAYLLDIDLAVLSRSTPEYEIYETAIRREYACLDAAVYRKGRCQVLAQFLTRPRIYRTESFGGSYEQQARANIRQAMHRLTQEEQT
ncbi:hypothetical protein [Acetonema longum]|uniref:Uncharacterized protein n=1 Tax=Acetonema longum DSM 6540 TaxID=1009370 RepID=F7NE44_9FIRM|nr:hypothetical protein [Acetonema longum]EGO65699.1 hypothetical protein ALO_01534 [Acetonema longum DSM 6540]